MANRLASATSPYLLQHADNPVDWYEWEPEAFAAARARDVPILLSVGYSACHWCHVMAHESFEDPETARYMNEHFVNVKVDREERPDVDRIYMDAVQATTGHGGWPMTVFLTPDGRPFFAGTYFPVDDRPGHPSFRRVMAAVQDAWAGRRDEVEDQADRLTAAVSRELPAAEEAPDREALDSAYRALVAAHDPEYGGFGAAPKFPQAPTLELLLRLATRPAEYPEAQPILEHTLAAMASGGIYDHVGGGFARYSVDRRWLVPHFEKMLYDNALLARVYLRGWQVTGAERFRTVAMETLDYILRDLVLPEGGLASAEDADSEGEEGKFYVFAHDEFHDVVGAADGAAAAACFGVTPQGNFDGSNILWLAESPEAAGARLGMSEADVREAVARARGRLYAHRARRIRPARDDKVVTAWNGFAVRALAEAGAVLHRSDYLEAARRNAEFVLGEMRRPDGRLLRSWRGGSGGVPGFSEDYGAYAVGLFALYQATGERRWFAAAARLTSDLVALFADPDGPGFFAAGHDAERLIARPKEVMDNPTPSGNSLAAEALLHVYHYTGDDEARRRVEAATRLGGRLAASYPTAAGHLLAVVATAAAPPKEVVIVGDPGAERQAMVDVVWSSFRPDCFLAVADADNAAAADQIPLLGGRVPHDGPPAAYVCRRFVCELPAQSVKALKEQLSA